MTKTKKKPRARRVWVLCDEGGTLTRGCQWNVLDVYTTRDDAMVSRNPEEHIVAMRLEPVAKKRRAR